MVDANRSVSYKSGSMNNEHYTHAPIQQKMNEADDREKKIQIKSN